MRIIMELHPIDELEKQRRYNSNKSRRYKKLYYWFGIVAIILSSTTTVILIVSDISPLIPGIVSAISAILGAISHFMAFQKHWINCRFMTETLKSEKRKYIYEIGDYEGKQLEQKEKILAENLDKILSEGNDVWKNLMLQTEEEK